MKKIPTLFERDFFDDHTAKAKPIVTTSNNLEVVGNVFDNPKLLEGSANEP